MTDLRAFAFSLLADALPTTFYEWCFILAFVLALVAGAILSDD